MAQFHTSCINRIISAICVITFKILRYSYSNHTVWTQQYYTHIRLTGKVLSVVKQAKLAAVYNNNNNDIRYLISPWGNSRDSCSRWQLYCSFLVQGHCRGVCWELLHPAPRSWEFRLETLETHPPKLAGSACLCFHAGSLICPHMQTVLLCVWWGSL